MTTEERVSRLEGAYEQVSDRLNEMNQNINGLRNEVSTLRDEMNRRFFWMFGFMGAMWVTIILAVLFGN